LPVTQKSCTRYTPVGVADSAGGVYLAWADDRCLGHRDIYAARVTPTGVAAAGWPKDGLPVCTQAGNQIHPAVVADGAGGAIVAWDDGRSGTRTDIFAQHVLAGGTVDPSWPVDGL